MDDSQATPHWPPGAKAMEEPAQSLLRRAGREGRREARSWLEPLRSEDSTLPQAGDGVSHPWHLSGKRSNTPYTPGAPHCLGAPRVSPWQVRGPMLG